MSQAALHRVSEASAICQGEEGKMGSHVLPQTFPTHSHPISRISEPKCPTGACPKTQRSQVFQMKGSDSVAKQAKASLMDSHRGLRARISASQLRPTSSLSPLHASSPVEMQHSFTETRSNATRLPRAAQGKAFFLALSSHSRLVVISDQH